MAVTGWPTLVEVRKALEIVKVDISQYKGLSKYFPIRTTQAQKVKWREIYGVGGMTTAHNLDADVKLIDKKYIKEKEASPFYFKEAQRWTESDILELAKLEDEYRKMTINEMIGQSMGDMKPRAITRLEWMGWQALLYGQVSLDENGVKKTAKYGVPGANLAVSPVASWDDPSTSQPITDVENVATQRFENTGYELGEIIMTRRTMQKFCNSEQVIERFEGMSLREKFMASTAPELLPILFPGTVFDLNDTGFETVSINPSTKARTRSFSKFIPDDYVLFMPKAKPGEIIETMLTPSIHNGSGAGIPQPGIFAFPVDKTGEANPYYDIVVGVYGLATITRPDCHFVMYVGS